MEPVSGDSQKHWNSSNWSLAVFLKGGSLQCDGWEVIKVCSMQQHEQVMGLWLDQYLMMSSSVVDG